jgi:hypothetical protein
MIRIDIDAAEMRLFPPDVGIVADAPEGTQGLIEAVRRVGFRRSAGRREDIRAARAKVSEEIRAIEPQMSYLRILRDVLPADAFVTDELSQVGFAAWYGFPVYEPRTFVSSGYQGTLGAGFPTALGVKVANPDRPVVAICGDGGFMFALAELATAVQFDIGVVALVFNNNSYGNVRRDQMTRFEGRVIAADLVNPDFMQIADAFGVGALAARVPARARTRARQRRPVAHRHRSAARFGSQSVAVHPSRSANVRIYRWPSIPRSYSTGPFPRSPTSTSHATRCFMRWVSGSAAIPWTKRNCVSFTRRICAPCRRWQSCSLIPVSGCTIPPPA